MIPRPLPGFVACTKPMSAELPAILPEGAATSRHGAASLAYWDLNPIAPDPVLSLSPVQWRASAGLVPDVDVVDAMRSDPSQLASLLPPFAAVSGNASGIYMVADWVGYRQLYYGVRKPMMSTSALLAGWGSGASLDHHAVAVQSQLGWQLGQRTLFDGVQKLPPGATARLGAHAVSVARRLPEPAEELSLEQAVRDAAAVLRRGLEQLLDDYPDAVVQLSGGQDSRLLLSAVPPSRRRGLHAITVGAESDGDVIIAREIAARFQLRHEVRGFSDMSSIDPESAWRRVLDAAMRLDAHSDPVALASLAFAEEHFEQGVRISGAGGEVARGFYYLGRVRDRAFDGKDAKQLAAWRMFANEAVEPGMLREDFAAWGRGAAEEAVFESLLAGGQEWFRATDELYLGNRVQRWAGTNDTAVQDRRIILNPLLDEEFLGIVSRLAPRDKAGSRFFALLQMELDPELGRIALDGRPAPVAYAHPNARNAVRRAGSMGMKVAHKLQQRLRRGNKPVAGSGILASRIAEHWRSHPSLLGDASQLDAFVRPSWTAGVLAGEISPRPSSVALVTNLVLAGGV